MTHEVLDARRNPLPLRSAQSASTAIDIVAAAAPYEAAVIPGMQHTLQHSTAACSHGNDARHRLRRSVHASQVNTVTGKGQSVAAAGHSQHGPCGSSDVSCTTAGPLQSFSGATAAAATIGGGRATTPCSPYMPPLLGVEAVATDPQLDEASRAAQLADAAASMLLAAPQPGAPAAGGGVGSRTRKRKGAALQRRQRRAARHVTTVAGHLRLKR